MTNDQIKEIALANGFKLKEQPSGEMDLNPYVYDFARALLRHQNRILFKEIKDYHPVSIDGCLFVIQSNLDKLDEVQDD